jgi:hypothetical protein
MTIEQAEDLVKMITESIRIFRGQKTDNPKRPE